MRIGLSCSDEKGVDAPQLMATPCSAVELNNHTRFLRRHTSLSRGVQMLFACANAVNCTATKPKNVLQRVWNIYLLERANVYWILLSIYMRSKLRY